MYIYIYHCLHLHKDRSLAREQKPIKLINENKIGLSRFYSVHYIHHFRANVFPFMHLPDRIVCPEAIYSGMCYAQTFAENGSPDCTSYIHNCKDATVYIYRHTAHASFMLAKSASCAAAAVVRFFLLFFICSPSSSFYFEHPLLCNNLAWLHASDERTRARSNSLFHNYVCRICSEGTHTACVTIIIVSKQKKNSIKCKQDV